MEIPMCRLKLSEVSSDYCTIRMELKIAYAENLEK